MKGLPGFASLFEELERDRAFSGAVLISREREVLFEGAYGFASRQLDVRNTLATRFHIASLTKMFTAMAALILVEDGRIALGEHPASYVSELSRLDERMTLHHMLCHTSGLRDVYDVPKKNFEARKAKNEGIDLLEYLARQPQLFAPGERWSYSSTGYFLVGYVLEKVTGQMFETLLTDLVLAPLAMNDSGVDRPFRVNPGRAYGHAMTDGAFTNTGNDALAPFDTGPAEMYSTVGDLHRWCRALFDGSLVSPEALATMFRPHARVDEGVSYGYGWFVGPDARWHGGGTPGFISRIKQFPRPRVSIITLQNANHIDPDPIIEQIASLVGTT